MKSHFIAYILNLRINFVPWQIWFLCFNIVNTVMEHVMLYFNMQINHKWLDHNICCPQIVCRFIQIIHEFFKNTIYIVFH